MDDNLKDANGLTEALRFAGTQEARAARARPHPKGGEYVIIPDGHKVAHMEPLERPLSHVIGKVPLRDEASFIAYFNRFKNSESLIYADVRTPVVIGIIDHHVSAMPEDGTVVPRYCEHRVEFAVPWSEQWARWRAIDGKNMGQVEFAEFIEENYVDVLRPDSSTMLEIVTNLEAKKNVAFVSGVRLQTGDNQLTFTEETKSTGGKGSIMVPADFEIGVPVFFGGTTYQVRVLLRYRVSEGRLTFTVKMNRRQFVEQTAFDAMTARIAEKAGTLVLAGSPA